VTLAVTVVCQDGVVVAADSRTTLANHRMLRVASAWARAARRRRRQEREAGHAQGVRVGTGGRRHPDQQLEATGEVFEVSIPDRAVEQIATTQNGGGAAWRGQTDVVTRIVRGSDLELLERLAEAHGLTKDLHEVAPLLEVCRYRIPFDSMNLQDGIDFAVLCIRTTIDVQRLTLGTVAVAPEFSWPGVGGPIEIATVTAAAGYRWVQRTVVQGERPAGVAEGQT
jgi:hypothetical protein